MNNRYKIIDDSVSNHCCFGYTVVDTAEKHSFFKDQDNTMCECFDEKEAKIICDALNKRI